MSKEQEQPSTTVPAKTEQPGQQNAVADPKTRKPRGGIEKMEREDLVIPRIAIAQSTTKQVLDGKFPIGSLYNTVTNETYVKDGKPYLEFVPVLFGKSRRLWDKDNKANSLCMSTDGITSVAGDTCAVNCPFPPVHGARTAFDWGQDEKGVRLSPACTQYYNYLSLLAPYASLFPASISMGKTSAKTGKQFNSYIGMTGQDIFARVYAVSTELQENKKGRFGVFRITQVGLPAQDLFKIAEAISEKFMSIDYTIHEEGAEGEASASDETAGNGGYTPEGTPYGRKTPF